MSLTSNLSRPLPARTHPRQLALARPLELWHLLSLDAPTVASLWTWFLARTLGVSLPASSVVAMFLAVWTLYAADRLLDARSLAAPAADLEARHRFHHRHRSAFLLVLLPVSVALALLLPRLEPAALRLDLVLGSLVFGYFVLIHATGSARRLPKELAVGVFFSAAVFIPTVARRPLLQLRLLPIALLFAALCSLNCIAIYAWEHPAPTPVPSPDPAAPHPLTRAAVAHLPPLLLAVLAAALLACLVDPDRSPLLAIALAAASLLALHLGRRRIAPLTLRAAADLVLLTPVLLLPSLLH